MHIYRSQNVALSFLQLSTLAPCNDTTRGLSQLISKSNNRSRKLLSFTPLETIIFYLFPLSLGPPWVYRALSQLDFLCIRESLLCYIIRWRPYFTKSKMRILPSVYAHLWKPKMRIYKISLLYMRIFSFVYVHFGFRKCTYTKAKMHIYGSSLS